MSDSDDEVFRKSIEVLSTPPERPKRDVNWRDKLIDAASLRDLARYYGKWGINRLAQIARTDSVPVNVQVECIKILLDRGFGRVKVADDDGGSNDLRITIRHVLDNIPGKPYKVIEAAPVNGRGNGHADGEKTDD